MYVYTYLRVYIYISYYTISLYHIALYYYILYYIGLYCRVASCGIILLYHITLYHVYAYIHIYIRYIGICIIHIINIIYIYTSGSSWSWKFPHQSQNRSISPKSRKNSWILISTPERFRKLFECFLNVFYHSRTSEVSRTAKTTPVFFSPHQPPKSVFFGIWSLNKSSIGKLQV